MAFITLKGDIWLSLHFESGHTLCVYDWSNTPTHCVRELQIHKNGKPYLAYIDPPNRIEWFKCYYATYPNVLGSKIALTESSNKKTLSISAENGDQVELEVTLGDWIDYSQPPSEGKTSTGKQFINQPFKIGPIAAATATINGNSLGKLIPLPFTIMPGDYELPNVAFVNRCEMALES